VSQGDQQNGDASAPDAGIVSRPPRKTWKAGTLTYTAGGLVVLFCWLLFGDFSWSMRERSVGPIAHWYLSHLKVPNFYFALLLGTFPSLMGVIISPVISVKSDRHRGRWGRRIPFLLVTTPIATFGMIGIAFTPMLSHWAHTRFFPEQSGMIVSVACFGLFWAAFEFATIAASPVFNGLVNDVVPRPLLGRFYGLFRAVSLIDGVIFNYWIMGKVPDHFLLILCTIGIFYGCSFMLVCLKIREGSYPPPPPPAMATATAREKTAAATSGENGGATTRPGMARRFFYEAKRYCRECFMNPYYLLVFLFLKVAMMSFGPVNTFAIPYARSLGVSMDTYGKCLSLSFTISLCLAWFLGWAADYFHPLRMALGSLLCYVGVTVFGALYATTPGAFVTAYVAHCIISGCYWTSAASLAQCLFPHTRFAQFSSAAGICTAAANMTLGPLVGLLIDQTGGVFRYTFIVASGITGAALVTGFFVHRKFMKLGGPGGYVAPG
jgi:MFS family permease